MPFRFTWICDLLQNIEDIECRDPPHLPDRKHSLLRTTVESWFRKHRQDLDRPDADGAAILSTLLPHTRTDRVYSIKAPRLEKLIGRCLYYTTDKMKELGRWKEPGRGDVGECLWKIEKLLDGVPLPGPGVLTVEEVDAGLADIASRCRFSSPAVQKKISAEIPEQILQPLLFRMHSREKKWFVRLILKDFGRVVLDDNLVLGEFHFVLPPLLRFQNDFAAAMALLKGPLADYHAKPDQLSQKLLLQQAAQHLKPKIGVKIGRPTWYKARSIANCLQMVGDGEWVIERKYDGEFCEIHVNLSKEDNIQIFSKNGKDATKDRKSLLPAIRDSLKIGTSECQFRSRCILLGEMVVFNQLDNRVADFDKIRKHVSRSGSFLGIDCDSQPHPYENLMIFYFDILLVDDEVTMALPHSKRRKRLSQVITKIEGRAKTVEWKLLDFAESEAKKSLVFQFSAALHYRCEGLILKPNSAFFSLAEAHTGGWCKGLIKLKKDYMTDMGGARDVADFAIVAASFDVHEGQKCRLRNVAWTNFYLGCLVDNDNSYQERPKFKVVAIVKASHCIPPKELEFLNQIGKFHGKEFNSDESIEEFTLTFGRNPLPSFVFTAPLIVEVLGSSFEKPPNEDFYMLRHPRVVKTHMDRSWEDCITMQGLADMAREAKEAPPDGESQRVKAQVQCLMEKMNRSRDRSSHASRHTTPRSPRTSTGPLATLKSVASGYDLGTPVRAPSLTRPAPSTASIKTPSPATALIKAKGTKFQTSVSADFVKEVTPVSQASTQWTETIVTPVASARGGARKPHPTISPPRRNFAVSDTVNVKKISLSPGKEPPTRASTENSSCSNGPNTTRLKEPQPDRSNHAYKEAPENAAGGPVTAKDVSTGPEVAPEEELSFYEERELMSVQRRGGRLTKQQTATASPFTGISGNNTQSTKSAANPKPTRQRVSATLKSNANLLDRLGKMPARQRKDAEEVIARERFLKMTDSTQTIGASGEAQVQPEPKPTDPAEAFMLPFIPFFSNNQPMLTPPKSSPNEPLSEKEAQPPAPTKSPVSPPASSPPDMPNAATIPRANYLKENIPPPKAASATTAPTAPATPHRRPGKRRRYAADDCDISAASPRNVPRWRSPVYGRPRLPPQPRSSPPPTTTTLEPKPDPISLLRLPYDLPSTCVHLAPSLHHHARLAHTLLTQHFGVGALVLDLEHWRRGDSTMYESMGSTVGESQAFAGMRQLCLVEPGKGAECAEVVSGVGEVMMLGGGGEKVGFFDWRVIEDLVREDGLGEGEGWERGVWEKRFYAVV